jgi:hypothetical protein
MKYELCPHNVLLISRDCLECELVWHKDQLDQAERIAITHIKEINRIKGQLKSNQKEDANVEGFN